jgi:hypothetical protein
MYFKEFRLDSLHTKKLTGPSEEARTIYGSSFTTTIIIVIIIIIIIIITNFMDQVMPGLLHPTEVHVGSNILTVGAPYLVVV